MGYPKYDDFVPHVQSEEKCEPRGGYYGRDHATTVSLRTDEHCGPESSQVQWGEGVRGGTNIYLTAVPFVEVWYTPSSKYMTQSPLISHVRLPIDGGSTYLFAENHIQILVHFLNVCGSHVYI